MSFLSILFKEKKLFFIPLLVLVAIIIIETVSILILNSGLFAYTTDDAYIHLALAENILKGHYGINLQEYSSPSSSILWGIIIAPFTSLGFGNYIPLFINTLSAAGTLYIFYLVIKVVFNKDGSDNSRLNRIALLFLILIIPATNLIGSIFTGMEHPLQIFLTVSIVWGLITATRENRIPKWLPAVIILAPLIRYENLALSFASIGFLYLKGYKKKAVFSFVLIAVFICGFSYFLLNLGLELLPLSVFEKSKIISSGGSSSAVLLTLEKNISSRGTLLLIALGLLSFSLMNRRKNKNEVLFSLCIITSIVLHLIIGRPGRYILYIWAASVLSLLFLYKDWLLKTAMNKSFIKITAYAAITVIILSYKFIWGFVTIPVGSNNIYEQQYQMHRFAVEYYKDNVAVNDLGYVSYKNDYFVLDFVGLGSLEALNYWLSNDKSDWIDTLSNKYNVKLAMVYDDWIPPIPENWDKIAQMHLGKIKIAPSRSVVSFYLLDQDRKAEIIPMLEEFKKTLPAGVKLFIHK